MRINWDDSKSDRLKRERGLSLEEAAQVFVSGPYWKATKAETKIYEQAQGK
jgi:uncharacterized DUF497 family protein